MNKISASAAVLIGALFLTSLLAVPVSAAQADAPEYTTENEWVVGQTMQFDWKWANMDPELKEKVNMTILGIFPGLTLEEMGIGADAAFYGVLRVDDVTNDEYIISAKMAVKLATNANIKLSGEMPKAGNYNISVGEFFSNIDWNDFDMSDLEGLDLSAAGIDVEEKILSANLAEDFALIIGGTVHLEKETHAIKSMEFTFSAAAVVSVDVNNVPTVDTDSIYGSNVIIPTNVLLDVTYDNYDVDLRAVFDAKLNLKFEPALNLYEFPLEVGNDWTIDSTVNVTGEASGFLDITGLPEDMESALFNLSAMKELNITEFPIKFDDLISDGINIIDGKLKSFEENIHAEMSCKGEELKEIFGKEKSVYTIEVMYDGETTEIYYTSDLMEIFASTFMSMDGNLPIDMEMFATFGAEVKNENVTAEEAMTEIEAIETYHESVAKKARGEDGLDMMTIALIAVAAIAIIAVGSVFVLRRRK